MTITINPVNDPPVAFPDSYETNEDEVLNVPAPGVLENDIDVDGDALIAVLVSGPSHGTLTLQPDGSFTYIPNPNYYGSDSFWYRAYDGELSSSSTKVNLIIHSVNDPPDCDSAVVTPSELWPPDHTFRDIVITVSDIDSDTVDVTAIRILQDEPVDARGNGDGHTCPDAIKEPLQVRAERAGGGHDGDDDEHDGSRLGERLTSGPQPVTRTHDDDDHDGHGGNGRVVHIFFEADDGEGGVCEGEVTVCIPHDANGTCIDEGALYDATVGSGEVEGCGVVEWVNPTEQMFGWWGLTMLWNDTTEFEGLDPDELEEGEEVEIEAEVWESKKWLAHEIKKTSCEESDDEHDHMGGDDGRDVEIKVCSAIEHVDMDNHEFVVHGVRMRWDEKTKFKQGGPNDLKVGVIVKVEGHMEEEGEAYAEEVRFTNNCCTGDEGGGDGHNSGDSIKQLPAKGLARKPKNSLD